MLAMTFCQYCLRVLKKFTFYYDIATFPAVYLYSKIAQQFSSIDVDRGMCLPLERNGPRPSDKVNRFKAIANISHVVSASADSAGLLTGNRLAPGSGGPRSLSDLGDPGEPSGRARPFFRSFEEHSRCCLTKRNGKMDGYPTGARLQECRR
jgi:hypothetical protein